MGDRGLPFLFVLLVVSFSSPRDADNLSLRFENVCISRWGLLFYCTSFWNLQPLLTTVTPFTCVVSCNEHLCLFLTLTQWCSSQKRGIATLGKLHQLADKLLLFRRGRDVVQYLVFLGSVDTDVLGCAKVAYLRIKVMGVNVIDWLLIKSRIYNLIRWTTKKRASFFPFLYSAKSQRTLCLMLQR